MNTSSPVSPRTFAVHGVLFIAALVMLYPLGWMLSSSFKPEDQIFTDLSIWPSQLTTENYTEGFAAGQENFARYFLNSVLISIGAVIGNVLSCSLAAYAFARLQFRGKKFWFGVMIGTVMLPFHATLIPQYFLFHELGWIDTFAPLIVPKFLAVDAFFVFLMVQFIRSIPVELDQAAAVDGCSPIRIFTSVIFPLLRPALVTTAAFTFIWTYDDFFSQLIYLADSANYTVPLGLRMFLNSMGESSYGSLFAMSILTIVPVFLLFIVFQRKLVEGISTTGLKG